MTEIRPDDLSAQIVTKVLEKVPELPPEEIEDLIMGTGSPGGEQGFNIGRATAVLAGLGDVPGTTVNRYCSSSLQTIRMAAHAIKAGEGDAFIAAGVECVSRYGKGNADSLPDTATRSSKHPVNVRKCVPREVTATGLLQMVFQTSTLPWAKPLKTSLSSRASAVRLWTSTE